MQEVHALRAAPGVAELAGALTLLRRLHDRRSNPARSVCTASAPIDWRGAERAGRWALLLGTGAPMNCARRQQPVPVRWKRFYPDGSRQQYVLHRYDPPGYPVVEIAHWTPRHGYVADWTACLECGEVEEAGGHHRDGCSLAPAHRAWCVRCQEHPPIVQAEPVQ
jgi:hypothetical protein